MTCNVNCEKYNIISCNSINLVVGGELCGLPGGEDLLEARWAWLDTLGLIRQGICENYKIRICYDMTCNVTCQQYNIIRCNSSKVVVVGELCGLSAWGHARCYVGGGWGVGGGYNTSSKA